MRSDPDQEVESQRGGNVECFQAQRGRRVREEQRQRLLGVHQQLGGFLGHAPFLSRGSRFALLELLLRGNVPLHARALILTAKSQTLTRLTQTLTPIFRVCVCHLYVPDEGYGDTLFKLVERRIQVEDLDDLHASTKEEESVSRLDDWGWWAFVVGGGSPAGS